MSTRNHKPLPEEIKEWLEVDQSIPEGLRWKKDKGRVQKGDPAGCKFKTKLGEYYVLKFNKISYLNHRIIYFIITGRDPGKNVIDHIDYDKNNKRIRLATIQENLRYRKKSKKAKGKYKGVTYRRRDKLWEAKITIDGKAICLGYFKLEVEAAKAYDKAAREYFKEFALTNFIDNTD